MLLELLSDFQITIPELGQISATTMPIVVLTSNNSRELTEALKRRCLYLWLDYPELEREMEIVRLHAPELPEALARRLVEVVRMVRGARPEEAALDRRVDRLGADAAADGRRGHRPRDLRAVDVDHRQAPHRHRPGRRAGRGEACRRPVRPQGLTAGPPGLAAKLLGFCEELRSEGVAVGTSEILDAFAALEQVPWTSQRRLPRGAGGDDRQVPGGPPRSSSCSSSAGSSAPPRPRRSSAGSSEEGAAPRGRRAARHRRAARADPPGDRRAATRTRCATWRGWRSPPSAARARAPAWSASTCSGSAARSASPPGPSRRPRTAATSCRRSTATSSTGFERHLRRELERDLIERTATLPPSRPLAELDRALPTSPTQDLAAVHRAVSQMKRRLATLGHEQRGRAQGPRRSTCGGRCAPRWRPAACRCACATGRSARAGRRSTSSATSRPRSPRPASSSSPSCTPCTTRSANCAASSSSSGSPR